MRDINTIVRLNNKLTVGTPVNIVGNRINDRPGRVVKRENNWVLVNTGKHQQWVDRGNVNIR